MTKRYISPQSGPVDIKTDKDSHYHSQDAQTPKEIVVGAYMPTESEVKEAYQRGEFINKAMSEQRWQRWLCKVKAGAWREGHRAAWEASGDGWNGEVNGIGSDYDELVRGGMFEDNPYESEEVDES